MCIITSRQWRPISTQLLSPCTLIHSFTPSLAHPQAHQCRLGTEERPAPHTNLTNIPRPTMIPMLDIPSPTLTPPHPPISRTSSRTAAKQTHISYPLSSNPPANSTSSAPTPPANAMASAPSPPTKPPPKQKKSRASTRPKTRTYNAGSAP